MLRNIVPRNQAKSARPDGLYRQFTCSHCKVFMKLQKTGAENVQEWEYKSIIRLCFADSSNYCMKNDTKYYRNRAEYKKLYMDMNTPKSKYLCTQEKGDTQDIKRCDKYNKVKYHVIDR